jgi:hypothetical protein
LVGACALVLLLLDGRTALGAAWPAGARFGLAAALFAGAALFPRTRPAADLSGWLVPLPVLAAAAALDLSAGADPLPLLRASSLLLVCLAAGSLARPGGLWWGGLALLALLWTLAHSARSLGQPGNGSPLLGLDRWIAGLPPAGLLAAALDRGPFAAPLAGGLVLLCLAALSRWPRARPAPAAALGLLIWMPPAGASAPELPERLAWARLELEGPLSAVELQLAGRAALVVELDLEADQRLDLELPWLRPSPLDVEPEAVVRGSGRVRFAFGRERVRAVSPSGSLARRPAPEPGVATPRSLPLGQAALIAAALVAAASAPRGPSGVRLPLRILLLGALPIGLALWIAPGLARPPELSVATTLDLDGGPVALEQRAARERLALSAAIDGLVTWPAWAPAWIEARWDPLRGSAQLTARAPGARLVERRWLAAPATEPLPEGWRRWDRRPDGGFDVRGAPGAGAPPAWALWPTPPGRAAWWASRAEGSGPVWRWCREG